MLANVVALTLAAGCDQSADARSAAPSASVQTDQSQTGMGEPYQLAGTEVWNVPDKLDGRTYQVYVALPPSYDASPNRTYPVLYVTDAHYAFPLIRQFARRMNVDSPVIAEHILVGLAYALGEEGNASRRLDYTPTPTPNRISGGGPAYQAWLKGSVLPFIENQYRADASQRVLLGHSYGGLLAAQVLFSDPEMFSGYVLGSPSLWYDNHHMFRAEAAYAAKHDDLKAKVFMYIGEKETPATTGNSYDMVGDNARMNAVLKGRNYPGLTVSNLVVEGEDHQTVAPVGFMRGLGALLPAK